MYDVSNIDANGDFLPDESLKMASNRANEEFHTDSSFNALPTKWSLLSARIVPPIGADTVFVDTRAAYDALPDDLKIEAENAVAEHYFWKTRGRAGFNLITDDMKRAMPPVPQRVVRVIPESGRKALLIGNHATHVIGWPLEEGRRFLREAQRVRDAAAVHVHPQMARRRPRHLGQSLHLAPRNSVRRLQVQAGFAAHDDQRARSRDLIDGRIGDCATDVATRFRTSTIPASAFTTTQSPVSITSSGFRSSSVIDGTRMTTAPSATLVVISLKIIAFGAVPASLVV